MNKRGQMQQSQAPMILGILGWVGIVFFITVFLGLWVYGFNVMNDSLAGISVSTNANGVNISDAAANTIGQINNSMNMLSLVAFAFIFGSALAIPIANFKKRVHPILFFVYIIIVVVAVIVSAYISNSYETLLTGGHVFSSTLMTFRASSFVLLNLPIWTSVIGVLGIIFMFIGIQRDNELGGGIF